MMVEISIQIAKLSHGMLCCVFRDHHPRCSSQHGDVSKARVLWAPGSPKRTHRNSRRGRTQAPTLLARHHRYYKKIFWGTEKSARETSQAPPRVQGTARFKPFPSGFPSMCTPQSLQVAEGCLRKAVGTDVKTGQFLQLCTQTPILRPIPFRKTKPSSESENLVFGCLYICKMNPSNRNTADVHLREVLRHAGSKASSVVALSYICEPPQLHVSNADHTARTLRTTVPTSGDNH